MVKLPGKISRKRTSNKEKGATRFKGKFVYILKNVNEDIKMRTLNNHEKIQILARKNSTLLKEYGKMPIAPEIFGK